MIKSTKPVIAACAVRTGCGNRQTSRAVSAILKSMGLRVAAAVRRPMPTGNLAEQILQRSSELADLDRHRGILEPREEYERSSWGASARWW